MITERVIARLHGEAPGPTLLILAGLHGNEPQGVDAAQVVLDRVRDDRCEVRGDLIGMRGNLRGLAAKRRFLARDLNRLWTPDRVAAARAVQSDPFSPPTLDGAELTELAELSDEIDRILAAARGPVYAMDLHTTSAPGTPFAVVGANRELAAHIPMPGIAGIEELLEGVLTRYLSSRGCITVGIEGGQIGTPTALENLEAALTIGLAASGVVDAAQVRGLAAARATLAAARGALPQRIEVTARHAVHRDDRFVMEPGFANIQEVTAGTLLARDKSGEIRAPSDGLVLLPLYQPQGSDGFFFGRAAG